MSDALKPCPWCGKKPEKTAEYCGSDFYKHYCDFVHFAGIAEVWNHRPSEEYLQELIEQLELALRDILRISVMGEKYRKQAEGSLKK